MGELLENYQIIEQIEFKSLNSFYVEYIDHSINSKNTQISIGIASAITAYARVMMSEMKNNHNFTLFYTDTDSIFVDKPLDYLLGDMLGEWKLEYTFKEIVFLAPKIYAGITTDGQYICKVKGFKNAQSIPFEDMKSLLKKIVI